MSQIRVDHLTFSYDGSVEPVFENAIFSLDTDWKLGLIGRNGKGKTTFVSCHAVSCPSSSRRSPISSSVNSTTSSSSVTSSSSIVQS